MDLVKSGRQRMLPPNYEHIGFQTARVCAARASHPDLKLCNCVEALEADSAVGKWIQLAQTAALGFHPYILEDGPEIPTVGGPHAEEGGEILEGMYAEGCTSIEDSRLHAQSGRAGMPEGQVLPALSRRTPVPYERDYWALANPEMIREDGPASCHAQAWASV
jgi:hypothetical protein